MSALLERPSKQTILEFLFLYRFITLGYVAFLSLTSLRHVPILSFALIIIYNILIYRYRTAVIEKLYKYPYLIAIDLLFTFLLRINSGVKANPYYLYSYSPLFLGGFVFGYIGAFLLAGIESTILVAADYTAGIGPSYRLSNGEHTFTYALFYLLIAVVIAYIADLANQLEETSKIKATVDSELVKARKCLELSMVLNQLSMREIQVLRLTSKGKTVDQIAIDLGLSKNTIKTYLKRAYEKLNVSSKQQAIAILMRQDSEVGQ